MISPRQMEEAQPAPGIDLPGLVERAFAADGGLARHLDLAHRPPQATMALSVAQALQTGRPLFFEAGTGTGKSLAYLVPALLWARARGRPGLISTNTINLQEQIRHKDLELCRRLFDEEPALAFARGFRVALLVGRANYLCGTRLAQALRTKSDLFASTQQLELQRLAEWAGQTTDGLRHELNPPPSSEVWEWVNADSAACHKKHCTPQNCFYRKAKAEVAASHLILLNHSLLFALLGAGAGYHGQGAGLLYPDDFLVLDEAHTVPDIASEYAGWNLSSYGLDRLLKMLHHPRHHRGLLSRLGRSEDRAAVESARTAAEAFFGHVRDEVLRDRPVRRVFTPGWAPPLLHEPLGALADRLGHLAGRAADEPTEAELKDLRTRLLHYQRGLAVCLDLSEERHVYWVEQTGRKIPIYHLRTAPLEVAEFLRRNLFGRQVPVILTSATLAEGPRLDSFQDKCGAPGTLGERVDSPFDYPRCMRVFLAEDGPLPDRSSGALDTAWLAEAVRFCCLRARGGTLALFTSYADMNRVAESVEPALREAGRTLLLHGRDGQRSVLVRRFSALGNGILFGTESFWNGVDVPGSALSQVIITRLPFENPSHPVAEARAEWFQQRGEQPFAVMTLPQAVVKFRQGIGRLIRRTDDLGTITVLDSRIVRKPYGRQFLEVLPGAPPRRFNRLNRDEIFQVLEA